MIINNKTPVGEVRPSQLLWTYGPGALIDLPNLSVVTLGIDRWEKDRCQPIQEARLLAAVRKELGAQVENLRMPPFQLNEITDQYSAEATIGVPVRPFPRWMRCVKCGLLSPYDAGLFEIKEHRYRPERTRFVHKGCRGSEGDKPAKDADAVPARFLLACRDGHLDDFPWHYFVHGGNSSCKGTLRFYESGASLQTENLWVKCDTCETSRSLAQAFGKAGKENLPACRGRHPHLDHFDNECDEEARAVLLGATNSWFPITLSALAIPQSNVSPLHQIIIDYWDDFADVEDLSELKGILKALKKRGEAKGIEKHEPESVWSAIEAHQAGGGQEAVNEADIKGPEWDVLTEANPPTDYPHFMSKKAGTPSKFEGHISRVLLLERLREVNALLGFTRVEAPEESGDPDERPQRANLSRNKPDWVPANQVHGEGIFIQFDEEAIVAWESIDAVKHVDKMLRGGHTGWRNSRHLDPNEGYPGIRYAMLHTLSHLLIRELALECGYNAASIRERIYADTTGDSPQAGILIYTAAADSDGTLGGLVDLGKPESLGRLLEQALNRSKVCSSDPLCSEHDPEKDRSLHGAACHACSLVAETSCEQGNRYLDRSLLVPTLECVDAAFFKGF
ncbi:DrmB family protein [Aeromonas bestiarum]|uniref:DrmB family protein n=1 Tax=Aeromonas bestiarum TaxID=105751 RepID=UPI003D1F93B2